ncbi:MAG: hypothetical protein U0556_12395 [Dehalococcoidia bacterium]
METRERLDTAVAKLAEAREAFDQATRALDPSQVDDGASWSVLDHVRHVSHSGAYPRWIQGLATDRSFKLPNFGGPAGYWAWTRQNALEVIDQQIEFARSLSDWQLSRRVAMGPREVDVIDLLEGMAGHYLHHADVIRRLSGQSVGAPVGHPED